MRILLINNAAFTFHNGAFFCEKKTGEFAKQLSELDNQVIMYGQFVCTENLFHSFDIEKNGIKVIAIRRKKNKILNYLCLYLHAFSHVRNSDFVYMFYPSSMRYVALICVFLKKPYGLYVRGERKIKDAVSRFFYKRSSVVYTVANYFTNVIRNFTGKKEVYSIRPMLNFSEKDIVCKREYSSDGILRVLFLARIEKDKGVDELLTAVKILKDKNYNFIVEMVGDGAYLSQTKLLIEKLDIGNNVLIKGAVVNDVDIKNCYLNADLYILPTYHEGFPRTLYEAMIFKLPIATTFVGAISGVMRDGFNCIKLEPYSDRDIVRAVEYAIGNPEAMIKLAENAAKDVLPIVDSARLSHAADVNNFIKNSI